MEQAARPTVITIKWGTEFEAEDVNILKNAAIAHSKETIQFICLTDDAEGLDPDILAMPIPIEGLERFPRSSCGWGKICLFHPALNSLFDHALFLDIDTIVVGPLDAFFAPQGPVMQMLSAGHRWRNMDETLEPMPATGAFTYAPRFHNNIFESFQADPEAAYANFELEQDFVGHHAAEKSYFPVHLIESFKYHLRRNPGADLFLEPRPPGPEATLVAFHGFPRPRDVAVANRRWARFPRSGARRPKWLTTYWNKYSRA